MIIVNNIEKWTVCESFVKKNPNVTAYTYIKTVPKDFTFDTIVSKLQPHAVGDSGQH